MSDNDEERKRYIQALINRIKMLQEQKSDPHETITLKKILLSKDGIITDIEDFEDGPIEVMTPIPFYTDCDIDSEL